MTEKSFEEHREIAEALEQGYLERAFEPLLNLAFKGLCKWLPNRSIKVIFGMGTFVIDIEKKSKNRSLFFDSYGSVNDSAFILNNIKDTQINNPILKLVQVCEELTDIDGHMLCFNDLSYIPKNREEQGND